MFRTIVSNLPYNPGMLQTLGFYSDRLKKEKSLRRLSFVFVALTMMLQIVVVASPPERSLAVSSNHIIDGLRTRNDILRAWDAPGSDVPAIYGTFGVKRSDIAKLPSKPNSTIISRNNSDQNIWTIGRNSIRGRADIKEEHRNSQLSVQYAGDKTATSADDQFVYMRNLKSWNIRNDSNTYSAFKGTLSSGKTFWILVDCGNFTQEGRWTPPTPQPEIPEPKDPLKVSCSIANSIVIKPSDTHVTVPVRINVPAGSSVPKGSSTNSGGGSGLHLGITTVGSPASWNKTTFTGTQTPDKQTDYVPQRDGITGLTYYDFVWPQDNETYRRYFVSRAQSKTFTVNVRVKVNKVDRRLVVRLLDREIDKWLSHDSACETKITREQKPPTPKLAIKKTIVDKPASLKPGDTYTYLIQYRNTVRNSLAEDVVITDELATEYFDVVSPSNLNINNGNLIYEVGGLSYTSNYQDLEISVRLKDQLPNKLEFCNIARIDGSNIDPDSSKDKSACAKIIIPCEYDPTTDTGDPECIVPELTCELLTFSINRTTRKVRYRADVSTTNPRTTKVLSYSYDYGDGSDAEVFNTNTLTHDEAMHTFGGGNIDITSTVVVTYTPTGEEDRKSIDCTVNFSFDDEPIGQHKSVKNLTKELAGEKAEKTKVNAGDELVYALKTSNSQDYERTNIDISDYIGDILDYAILDDEFLKEQGGSFDEDTKTLSWTDLTISANSSVVKEFKVTLKDPIPATNQPSSVSSTHDCHISNEYGNEVSIAVDCPVVKGLETLPNTGPGTSIVIMGGATVITGYFFSRSRLLAKETALIRRDFVATGGA